MEAAAASRRRSPALRLPYDTAVAFQRSGGGQAGRPGQRVLAVTRVRSNHCEDPAAFRALAFVHGVGTSVLAVKGAVAPAPRLLGTVKRPALKKSVLCVSARSLDAVFSPVPKQPKRVRPAGRGQTQQRQAVLKLARHRSALGNFLCILFNFPGGPIKRYHWPRPIYVYMGQFSIALWGPKPISTARVPTRTRTSVYVKPAQA